MNFENAILFSWALEPVPAFALLVTAILYARGWRRLHRLAPARFPLWRLNCFLGGLATIYFALASPLDAFASFLLMAHMVQHLLLTMVAPPLLLLGCPQLPLLMGLPRKFASQGLGPFLHWKILKGFFHGLTHPLICLGLFISSNLFWHFPSLFELALHSRGWHQVEHFCFLATSLLFWYPVIQPWPSRSRWPRWAMLPYLVLADLQNTALAAFLSFCDRIVYSTYLDAPRLGGYSPADDQAGAGAIMWVPGSIVFLVPAGLIMLQFLSKKRAPDRTPPRRAPEIKRAPEKPFDLLKVPVLGPLIRSRYFRSTLQFLLFGLAVAIIVDGLLGPQMSPMNLAGVLPWTHWRAFTVIALLIAGNLFCMACPFTFVRDLGRKILPANLTWPRALRSKWLAVALLVLYLWAYEAFDLWDKPSATALIILGYFLAALVIDGFFRGASFCKYVCPIGQFHFVQSLASPLEIKIREPDICASCRTFDCIKGNAEQRGCELELFQPRKSGSMDCTFCLDCVKACPHDNVGILAVTPGHDLIHDQPRSSVGRYANRPDLAALVLVLTFGAFANAAAMVSPVANAIAAFCQRRHLSSDVAVLGLLALLCLVALPAAASALAAKCSSAAAGHPLRENLRRFSMALAPLGFGMWLAHFSFHLFTGFFTPWPVFQRIFHELGLSSAKPDWNVPSLAFYDLPGLELTFLGGGLLLSLYLCWRIARQMNERRAFTSFLPWGLLASCLYAAGVWIIFQPMEMRGMIMN